MSSERMLARQEASDVGLDVYGSAESSPESAAHNFASRIQRQPISTAAEVMKVDAEKKICVTYSLARDLEERWKLVFCRPSFWVVLAAMVTNPQRKQGG